MATWIKHNGEVTTVTPKDGKAFSLEELQGYVQTDPKVTRSLIEMLPLIDGTILWMHEEGKINSFPLNVIADVLAHRMSGIGSNDFVVGNCLVATRIESGDGEEEE